MLQEHVEHVQFDLQKLQNYSFYAKHSKYEFFQRSIVKKKKVKLIPPNTYGEREDLLPLFKGNELLFQ